MPADHDQLTQVEAACAELAAAGQPVTFAEVAARAQISRTTLYRRADLRAGIEGHRTRGQDASTLTRLTLQIDQLRPTLEPLPAKGRRPAGSNVPAANPDRPGHPGTVIHSRGKISRITRGPHCA